jgi:hypothetical protein
MSRQFLHCALGLCFAIAIAGCKNDSGSPTASNNKPAAAPATAPGTPAAAANPDNVNKPGINPIATTPPGGTETSAAPAASPPAANPGAVAQANAPIPVAPAATSPSPATEPGANPLFTLPPSKGPAPHKFQQLSLLRTSANGDLNLEMQLTGDGIYRIRDHTHNRSYAGSGELTPEQIADWAAALKDWESLKDSYVPKPAPKDVETVDIIYDGKKVSAITSDRDLPKTFAEVYKRLLDLNEQGRKAQGGEETKPGVAAPEAKEQEKPAAGKDEEKKGEK